MKIHTNFLFTVILAASLVFSGCRQKEESQKQKDKIPEISLPVKNGSHQWYYFTKTDFKPVERLQDVPKVPLLPWTEAVRISSANCTAFQDKSRAFAVVNRLGMLSFNEEEKQLSKDENIFSDRTAGHLIFLNETPIFSVFKSAFFNDTITDFKYSAQDSQHLFLIQFDPESKISYPIINCNNLTKLQNSEVTDYYWDGINWICCIKTISEVKTDFSYIKWKPIPSLLNLSPVNADNNISIEDSSQDEFRAKKEEIDFSLSPQRIKKLLAGFSKKTDFLVSVKNSGGSSWKTYRNTVESGWAQKDENETATKTGGKKSLNARAILSQSWSAALFEDGTLFLEGALPGKHILRNGKTVAVRLPKLPEDFIYSDFVISGTTLYAAWEETSFFKTGRAGFIEVNLNKTLYSKL